MKMKLTRKRYCLCLFIFFDAFFAISSGFARVRNIPTNSIIPPDYNIQAYNMGDRSIVKAVIKIDKSDQSIGFAKAITRLLGTPDYDPGGKSTSGLPVTITSSNPAVAAFVDGKIHIVGLGTSILTASQPGNDQFNPAVTITQVLTIVPEPIIVPNGTTTILTDEVLRLNVNTGFEYFYTWQIDGIDELSNSFDFDAHRAGTYTVVLNIGNKQFVSPPLVIKETIHLSPQDFDVQAYSAICRGSSTGGFNILSKEGYDCIVTITGADGFTRSLPFKTYISVTDLYAQKYSICITIPLYPDYRQCYDIVITEPADLSVYSTVNTSDNSLNLSLTGGTQYNIKLNGVSYTTSDNAIALPLKQGGNELEVTTDKPCQGTIKKLFNLSAMTIPYPNPFQGMLNLNLGNTGAHKVTVKIYNASDGKMAFSKEYADQTGVLQLDLNDFKDGVYVLHLLNGNSENIYKIIKK
ncbi:MAG TPA: T9SS type A sorting domain-containing protein [Mucilaginibacter sp.]|nr:T9SS type A sorting domain-containing protein [Mucilaginibacter sp.]